MTATSMVVAEAAAGSANSNRRLERTRTSCHPRPRPARAQGIRLRLPLTTRAWRCSIRHISREGACRLNNRHISIRRSPRHSFQRHLCLHMASTNHSLQITPSRCPSDQSPPQLRRRGRRKAMWLLHAYRASERISGEKPPRALRRWDVGNCG